MPKVDDQKLAVGAVYARALLAVAEERGLSDQVLEELTALAGYLDRETGLHDLLANPLTEADVKERLLEKALRGRASDLLVDALDVVARKQRLGLLPAIAEAYRRAYRDARGIVDVSVKSAVPLTEALRARLVEAASRYTGKKAELFESVDPALLGGLVVQVGDEKIDASVAARLKTLSNALLHRGAQEIQRGTGYVSA
jgi:F-type H+-transporting ATPase subunit delta